MHNDNHFFAEEGYFHDMLSVPMGTCLTPKTKNIPLNSIACVTNDLAVFCIDTAHEQPHMTC